MKVVPSHGPVGDATLIAEKPKIGKYVNQMKEIIGEALGVSKARIGVKATTEEGLGFTGAKEGVAAHAVALLSEKK